MSALLIFALAPMATAESAAADEIRCGDELQRFYDAAKLAEPLSIQSLRDLLNTHLVGECASLDPFLAPKRDGYSVEQIMSGVSDDYTVDTNAAEYPCVGAGAGSGSIQGWLSIPAVTREPIELIPELAVGEWEATDEGVQGIVSNGPIVWGMEGAHGGGVITVAKAASFVSLLSVGATCVDEDIVKCVDLNPWAEGETCFVVGTKTFSCTVGGSGVFSDLEGVIVVSVSTHLRNPACKE